MPVSWRDSAVEMELLDRADAQRRMTQQEASRFLGFDDPAIGRQLALINSSRFVNHARTFNWQDIGVSYQLAREGVGVDDPVAIELATAAGEQQVEQSQTLVDSVWADANAGEPMFDGDSFIGFSGLEREANDTLIGQVDTAIAEGTVNRADMNARIAEGGVNPLELLAEVDQHVLPYEWALMRPQVANSEEAVRSIYSLPYDRLKTMYEENRDSSPEGMDLGMLDEARVSAFGEPTSPVGGGWKDIAWAIEDDDTAERQAEFLQRLDEAAVARGEVPPEDEGTSGFRRAVGAFTKPLVGVMDVGRQLTINRVRQNASMLSEGFQGIQAAGMTGRTDFLQQPTLAAPSPVTPAGTAALQAAAGVASLTADVGLVAAGSAGLGSAALGANAGQFAVRAAAALAPEVLEAGLNTPRALERFRATDLGVYAEHPELRGDGLLFDQDLTDMRQRREEAISPSFENGDLLTFGRLAAIGVGTIATPLHELTDFGEEGSAGVLGVGYLSQAAQPGSDAYNTLSGAVDFGVALAGPGEVIPDAGIVGLRNARALPGIRRAALLGNQDPFRSAGAIGSSWRSTVLRADADEWLTGRRGQLVAERLSEISSPTEVWRAFRHRITPDAARQIADLDDANEITGFMRSLMGSEVQGVPRLGPRGNLRAVNTGLARHVRGDGRIFRMAQAVDVTSARFGANLPTTEDINVFRMDDVFRWTNDYMVNAAIPQSRIDEVMDGLSRTRPEARARYITEEVEGEVFRSTFLSVMNRNIRSVFEGNPDGRGVILNRAKIRAFREDGTADAAILRHTEAAEEVADRLTRHWSERQDGLSQFFIDRSGDNAFAHPVSLPDGTMAEAPMAHLVVEAHTGQMPVPSLASIRKLGAINSPLFDFLSNVPFHKGMIAPAFNNTSTLLEHITASLWKPLVLLRGAYIMRVVGEEQLRIATAGGDALVNNPMGWLTWAISRPGGANDDIVRAVATDAGGLLDEAVGEALGAAGSAGRIGVDEALDILRQNAGTSTVIDDTFETALRNAATDDVIDVEAVQRAVNTRVGKQGNLLNEVEAYRRSLVGDPRRDMSWKGARERQAAINASEATVYTLARRGDEAFLRGWAGEVAQLSNDTLTRAVAMSDGVTDDLVRQVMDDPILREELDVAQAMWGADAPFDLSNPADVRQYLTTINNRISIKTGDDFQLRRAIGTGQFGDDGIKVASADGSMVATDEFIDAVAPMADEFAPDTVKVAREVRVTAGRGPKAVSEATSQASQLFRSTIDFFGGWIIEKPTSVLSRSPVFRQNYWAYVGNNAGALQADDARRLLDNIPEGLPRDTRRTLRWRLQNSIDDGGGTMPMAGFDLAAKGSAMDATNDLLFSMATKSQWADALRIVAPFAQAWGEIITTWGRLAPQNPNLIRRVSQAKTVLGDPDFAQSLEQIPGWETIDGQGLISTNDFGDEVIVVPWANAASNLMQWAGLRQKLPAALPPELIPLASLNVGAGFLPGQGPATSILTSALLPENFKGRNIPVANAEIREVLWPFGEPTTDIIDVRALATEFVPSWMRYVVTALNDGGVGSFSTAEEANAYHGRVIAIAQWLSANDRSGKYALNVMGPENLNLLIEDSKTMLSEIGWAQAVTAFGGPGPTQPGLYILDEGGNVQLNVDDPNSGTFISAVTVGNLYRQFLDDATATDMPFEDAQAAAFLKVVEATGSEGSIFSVIGKSRTVIPGGVPVTRAAHDWFTSNREVHDIAPNTWGVFAPPETQEEGDFYMPMYLLGIEMGDRVRLTPEEWGEMAEDLLGDYLYGTVLADVERRAGGLELAEETVDTLTAYRRDLNRRLPSWREEVVVKRRSLDSSINELEFATAPGALMADHDLAEPIQRVTALRREVSAGLLEQGISNAEENPFGTSGATQETREAYDKYLTLVEQEWPQAHDVIENFFRAELRAGLEADQLRAEEEGEE